MVKWECGVRGDVGCGVIRVGWGVEAPGSFRTVLFSRLFSPVLCRPVFVRPDLGPRLDFVGIGLWYVALFLG